ncbi:MULTISPECIES: transketolase [Spirosoma]|uniref:Transketolase n=1 Tax=Spirosoma liriopis TaxID=2937440 RepID=A0ABT0HDX2_9BACT|nr:MULTISPECIES: transketolase [Spirosoma]MCK8490344.1 transketolase [Spirosoma liriopis]UHG89718.1 transketolase [Spirosoma oryzicola]
MRNEFSAAIERIAREDDKVVFITGDLGYNALENVVEVLGPRFINAGVAEQNMVGVAAGMAYRGYKVFCYSIAPFAVYRCLEQFRNDVCLHNMPVFLVGNGGGYGYGIMGSTHHAIEDLACLSSLQNVNTYIPAFADEVAPMLDQILTESRPAYLRLGAGPKTPDGAQTAGTFKHIVQAKESIGTVVALGPVAANVLTAVQDELLVDQFDVYTATNLPLDLPADLAHRWGGKPMLVVEEHVSIGGLAQQLSVKLLAYGAAPSHFVSLSAQGYPNGLYGDQKYHQQLSGLDPANIARQLASFMIY